MKEGGGADAHVVSVVVLHHNVEVVAETLLRQVADLRTLPPQGEG